MDLILNPLTDCVYLDAGATLYLFDGTPVARPQGADAWERVSRRDVPCLFDWQRDPGEYGPHYVTADIRTEHERFTAGGSILYVRAWCAENGASLTILSLFGNRNRARNAAQVAW